MELFLVIIIVLFVLIYRENNGEKAYKFFGKKVSAVYNKFSPYSFAIVQKKAKELKQNYSVRQYGVQAAIFGVGAFVISYLYFYNIMVSIIYVIVAIMFVPYLAFLRYKRVYSEYIFEQVQVYTTNVIMEFQTTQSFVKALEGVYQSGVLEDPILSDVKVMIDMAYENGTIEESVNYMNVKYDYHIIKNMHQIFLQITKEGAKDAGESLENMLVDIDALVEGVYRDRLDRAEFHRGFLRYGVGLYFLIMLTQFLIGVDTYMEIIKIVWITIVIHLTLIANTYFLLKGEKFYNENVGAE